MARARATPEIFGMPWWLPVGGVLALIMFPGFLGKLAFGAGATAVRVVRDAATGAVIAVGESVGIPATDAAKCQEYVDAGDWWRASFYCPAGTFLKEAGGAVIDTATGAIVGVATYSPIAEIIRLVPPSVDFKAWYAATGGALLPGETQAQAIARWRGSNPYTPSVMDFPPDTTVVLPGIAPPPSPDTGVPGQVSDWPAA